METLFTLFDYIFDDRFLLVMVLFFVVRISRKVDKLSVFEKPKEQQQQPQKDDFWKRYNEKPHYYVNKDEKK